MLISLFKSLIFIAAISFLPMVSYSLSASDIEKFKRACSTEWMKGTEAIKDKVGYRNFGEKYCNCVSTQPLETEADLKESTRVCMSQTLLQVVMENLENDEGLSTATEEKIEKECLSEWDFIATGLVGSEKGEITDYCKCVAPKLNDMNQKSDNMTDEDWNSAINSISAKCL